MPSLFASRRFADRNHLCAPPLWLLVTLLGLPLVAPTTGGAQEQGGAETQEQKKSSPAATRMYQAAANAQNNGSYRFAAEEWEKLIKEFPDDPVTTKARYYLGICRLQVQDLEGAEAAFTEVVAKHPKFSMMEETLLNLGWCQFSQAENIEQTLQDLDPDARTAAIEKRQKKLAVAAETFSKLLEKYPKGKRAHEACYFRGEALYATGDTEGAVASYQKLIDEFPSSNLQGDALYAIGVARQEASELEKALQLYDRFIADHASHTLITEVRLRKGEVLLGQGEPAEAEPFFKAASEVRNFELADYALFRLAYTISEQRDFARAAEVYASLPERFPNSAYVPQASMSVGRCWFRAGKWEQAEQSLKAHAEKKEDPFYIEANHWLARIRLMQDQPAEALKIADSAIAAIGDAKVSYLDQLMLDAADALYAMPDQQEKALDRLVEVADRLPQSTQAPQALYNATFLALELGMMDKLDALAARFEKEYGDDALAPDVAIVRAESLSQRQKYEEAEAAFRKVLADNPEHPEVVNWSLRLAFTTFVQGKYDETAKQLSDLLKLAQGDQVAEAHFLLGLCQYNQKDYAQAQQSFAAALKASPTWYRRHEAMLYVARCDFEAKQFEKAITALRQFLTTSPSPQLASQAHHWLGESLYAAGQFRDAAEAYRQVVALDPDSRYLPFSRYGQAWSYLKGGQPKEAISSFTALIDAGENGPRYDDALLGRGIALRQSGDNAAALDDLNAYLKRNPEAAQSADARYESALALVALKKWSDVISTLEQLIQQQPDYVNIDKALYELAWAHRNSDAEEKAIARFAELANKHADSPLAAEANFHLAEEQYAAKEYRKAMELYAGARSEIADREEIREKAAYKIGWCWFQLQEYDKALKLFQEQVAEHSEGGLRPDGLFMQAECYFKLKQHDKAFPIYMDVMSLPLSSDNVEALALLHGGQSAIQVKKWDAAVTLLSEIFARQPKSPYVPEAHLERGWARQNLGQLEEAFDDYAVTAETNGELGARSRFMMGETRFQQKAYSDAIKEFQRVMFYYGGDKAPESVKKWQARAALEAGRSAELLIAASTSSREKRKYIDEAKKFYQYILNNHPKASSTKTAQGRLDQLRRL